MRARARAGMRLVLVMWIDGGGATVLGAGLELGCELFWSFSEIPLCGEACLCFCFLVYLMFRIDMNVQRKVYLVQPGTDFQQNCSVPK